MSTFETDNNFDLDLGTMPLFRGALTSLANAPIDLLKRIGIKPQRKALSYMLVSLLALSACAPPTSNNSASATRTAQFTNHTYAIQATVESPNYPFELQQFMEQHPQIVDSTYLLNIPTESGMATCTGTMVDLNGKSFIVTADHCITRNVPYIELTQPHLTVPSEPIYTTIEGSKIFGSIDTDTIAIEVPTKPVGSGLVKIGTYDPNLPVFSLAFPSVPDGLVTMIINSMPAYLEENGTGHQAILINAPTTPGGSGSGVFQLDSSGNSILVATTRGIDSTQNNPTTAAYLTYALLSQN